MEHGIVNLKFVLAGVSVGLMLCIAAAMAVPALAQDGDPDNASAADVQYGDNINVGGDINSQVCQNIIGDISVNADQYNSGDQIAIGDGNVQAIAQEQNVSVNVVQNCIQQINSSLNGDDPGTDPDPDPDDPGTDPDDPDPDPDDPGTDPDGVDDAGTDATRKEEVLADTIPDKVLANTGGVSLFSVAGGGLILAGAGALFLLARFRRSVG